MGTKTFTFIFYLAASILVYWTNYGWIIETYSTIHYRAGSLGMGIGVLSFLLVYCTLTFSTVEKLTEFLQSDSFMIKLAFLVLGVLAIPVSMIVVVLYNNNNGYQGAYPPVDGVLNLVSLFGSSALFNVLLFLILKFFRKRRV